MNPGPDGRKRTCSWGSQPGRYGGEATVLAHGQSWSELVRPADVVIAVAEVERGVPTPRVLRTRGGLAQTVWRCHCT